jgi:hypothetical protein
MKRLELDMAEVWRVFVKNFQVTLPAAVPQHYSSVEYLDGPPLAPRGICQINNNPNVNVSLDLAMIHHIVSLMVPFLP